MAFASDRADVSYREFSTNGTVLAEAQLSVYERFHVDALTVASDTARLAADLGGKVIYPENQPPFVSSPILSNAAELKHLRRPDPARKGSRIADRLTALRMLVDAVGQDCLVLGWLNMPFAEACLACGLENFLMLLYDDPIAAHQILAFMQDCVIDYGLSQIETGAEMLGLGDSAASLLSPSLYREFALPYEQQVCEIFHDAGALIKLHICGDTDRLLQDMIDSGADLFNVDHMVDFDRACDVYSNAGVCFKGNLNPVTDFMGVTAEGCRHRCLGLLQKTRGYRYMLSAGCEMPAGVTNKVFDAFCQTPQTVLSGV
jgi:MtaA/CmuA family methyltransferase